MKQKVCGGSGNDLRFGSKHLSDNSDEDVITSRTGFTGHHGFIPVIQNDSVRLSNRNGHAWVFVCGPINLHTASRLCVLRQSISQSIFFICHGVSSVGGKAIYP